MPSLRARVQAMIGAIRRRRRLEIDTVIDGPGSKLIRFRDPKTGLYYVGSRRWSPVMVLSVKNDV